MAEHISHGPAEVGAEMDYEAHERSYSGFIAFSQVSVVATLNVLLALVLFAFGNAWGFWFGAILLVLTLIAAAVGLAGRSVWKPSAVVFAIGAVLIALSVG